MASMQLPPNPNENILHQFADELQQEMQIDDDV